jgi:ATP-dependent DNA ligase
LFPACGAPYLPGNRGLWLKVKCLYREEFVVVGWTENEGWRPFLGSLLLAYYDPQGQLVRGWWFGLQSVTSRSKQQCVLSTKKLGGLLEKRQYLRCTGGTARAGEGRAAT